VLQSLAAQGDIGSKAEPPAVVVFPENSYWGNGKCPFSSDRNTCLGIDKWPNPGPLPSSPPLDKDITDLAELAASYHIYLVINVADMRTCPPGFEDTLCATVDGVSLVSFNTQVVFGPNHNIAGKAYKNQLFGDWNTQPTPEMLNYFESSGVTRPIFEAPELGVTFAAMTCNDANDAALWHRIKAKGVTDVIISANWDQGPGQQTFQSIMMGLSYTYELNIVAVSASDSSGGSSIISNGKVLASLPSIFELIAPDPKYPDALCVQEGSIKPWHESAGCQAVYGAQVTSPPPKTMTAPETPLDGAADVMPSSWPAPDSFSCFALWVKELVEGETAFLKATGHMPYHFGTDYKVGRGNMDKTLMEMGNTAQCQTLPTPPSTGIFKFTSPEQPEDAVAGLPYAPECSVTADVAELGTKSERFLLQSWRHKVYLPDTPCPLDLVMCILMHCVGEATDCVGEGCDKYCTTVPITNTGYTTFSSVKIEAKMPAHTDVRPLALSSYLTSLSADELHLEGPFKYHDLALGDRSPEKYNSVSVSLDATTAQMSAGQPLGTLGIIGTRTGKGHDWPQMCNTCRPYDDYHTCGHFGGGTIGQYIMCSQQYATNPFMAHMFEPEEECMAPPNPPPAPPMTP